MRLGLLVRPAWPSFVPGETALGGQLASWTKEGLMSFTPIRNRVDSSFNVIVQSLLADDTLPFADALTAEHIQQAFDDEQVARHSEPAVASGTAPDRFDRTNKTERKNKSERTKSDDDSEAHSDARSNASKKPLFSRVKMTGMHPSPPTFTVL